MIIPPDMNEADENEMNEEIYAHLKKAGFVFPDTEEELSQFIELTEKKRSTIPDHLNDASLILKKGMQSITDSLNSSTDETITENLAQAAREGKAISDDVLKRMEEDRRKSENSNGTD